VSVLSVWCIEHWKSCWNMCYCLQCNLVVSHASKCCITAPAAATAWCTMTIFFFSHDQIGVKRIIKIQVYWFGLDLYSSVNFFSRRGVLISLPSLQSKTTFLNSTFLSMCTSMFAGWVIMKNKWFQPVSFADPVPYIQMCWKIEKEKKQKKFCMR